MPINLSQALRDNRLSEFIAQEEARGVGPIARTDFDTFSTALIKAPQSKGRTSRSPSGDGLSGKKTPRGSGQGVSR